MPTLSASAIAGYAKNAGVSGQNIAIATAIALAESGGNTEAVNNKNANGSTDYGLWQINSVHKDLLNGKDWRDPAQNAAMMYSVSGGGTNWKPWSVYKSGAYMTHMGAALAATPDTSVGSVQNASLSTDFTAIQNFAKMISDPHTWLRVGMVLGGAIMLYVAVSKSFGHVIPKPPGIKNIVKAVTPPKTETVAS